MRTAGDYRAMSETIERLRPAPSPAPSSCPNLLCACGSTTSGPSSRRRCAISSSPPTSGQARAILDKPTPYHPFGLPQPGYPQADATALGIDIDARPSLAEVMEVRGNRMALVRDIVGGLTDASLERVCLRLPAPGFEGHPEETWSVGRCLRVVMNEECEHRRYAVRDLTVLEADLDGGAAHHDAPP